MGDAMISIAICDNEQVFLDYYQSKLESVARKLKIDLDIHRFSSGEALLFHLDDYPNQFQIIYLDIVMGGINGIETALKVRKLNSVVKIIFLTSSTDYVFNAFDANASHYLIKDLHDDKFDDVFAHVYNQVKSNISEPLFSITTQQENYLIPFSEIAYFESFKRLVICHRSNKERIEYYYKISDLVTELEDKPFILIHRSFLVNMQYILKLSKTDVYLKNGVVLPVSRNNYEEVKDKLFNYNNQNRLK